MIRLFRKRDDEAHLVTHYPEALLYARAILGAAAPERRLTFKNGTVSQTTSKGFVAVMAFGDEAGEIKVRVEKNDGKFTVTKYMDGPVSETLALKEGKEG